MFELDLYGNAMTPTYLRALQAAILASPACAEHVIDNSAGKVPADEARAKDQAIADIMRAEGFGVGSRAVPAWHAKRALIGKWRGIVLASQDAQHPAVEGANTGVSGQTPGPVFLATTAGTATSAAPSAAGNVVQRIGFATSATEINFQAQTPVTLA